ncbi:NUDIX domain-containing protein [Demequina sp. NBRC 110055]|uniref:NUDIX hydrolase n=1 Tax=Demequina sp. NBRC 110055 TaxID=1570344 RepID=UPI000A0691A0|nr:NUDIX domain-containing protein [Demequina sp. NBRC 110055]
MATPDFILSLREKIGTEMLWLSGVTAVVLRDAASAGADGRSAAPDAPTSREILLVRRADTGAWTPVTGIIDPGEHPAVAGAREVLEEANVVAVPQALVRVGVTPEITYDNGDRSQYLDLTFRFAYVSGEPHPADGENLEAAWFPVTAMPTMSEDMTVRVAAALRGDDVAEFEF